jgi:hypothetical protein
MADAPTKGQREPTSLQNDINRAIEYRREYYKYAIGIASALLAFTVSFPPDLAGPPKSSWLIIVAWLGLGAAIIGGVWAHLLWAHFFISYRDYDNRGDVSGGKKRRRLITKTRRVLDVVLIATLAVGVMGVAVFATRNLDNIKTGDAAQAQAKSGLTP